MVQLSERAEKLKQELAEKDGKDVANRYAEIELTPAKRGYNKKALEYIEVTVPAIHGRKAQTRLVPVQPSERYKNRPTQYNVHKPYKKPIFSVPKIQDSFYDRILELFEDDWWTVEGLKAHFAEQNEICTEDFLKRYCNVLVGIGVLKSFPSDSKIRYRRAEDWESAPRVGQIVMSAPSPNARVGVVIGKKRHDVHPIDVLTVHWLVAKGERVGIIGSDIALPVSEEMEKHVLKWYKLTPRHVEAIRSEIKRKSSNKNSLSMKDRVLEALKWQDRVTFLQLSTLVANPYELDNVLLQLERSDRIVMLPGFPKTIALKK